MDLHKAEIKKHIREAISENSKLKEFLKSNHCEGIFIKEATKKYNDDIHLRNIVYRTLTELKTEICSKDPINYAIDWRNTKEGYDYWCNLHRKFTNYNKQN